MRPTLLPALISSPDSGVFDVLDEGFGGFVGDALSRAVSLTCAEAIPFLLAAFSLPISRWRPPQRHVYDAAGQLRHRVLDVTRDNGTLRTSHAHARVGYWATPPMRCAIVSRVRSPSRSGTTSYVHAPQATIRLPPTGAHGQHLTAPTIEYTLQFHRFSYLHHWARPPARTRHISGAAPLGHFCVVWDR